MQAPVTPFDDEDEVDWKILEQMVDFHASTKGATAIVALYNKAEPISLTIDERKGIARTTVDAVNGRLPVIVHVGHTSTDVAVELARHAEEVGADGIVCITPYYWPSSTEGVVAHFDAVFGAIEIPAMVYNSPHRVPGTPFNEEMLRRLLETHANFAGMKDASFNMDDFTEICRVTQSVRPDFAVMVGVEYLLGSVVVGGTGSFSACGAVAPNMVYALWDAIAEERWDAAQQLQSRISYLHRHLKDFYPSSLKVAMDLMGRPVGPCRLPLPTGAEAARERLRSVLEELDVFESEPHGW
jgi:dihydrodipicolinate synthase/N-acetylneuraminate lyase